MLFRKNRLLLSLFAAGALAAVGSGALVFSGALAPYYAKRFDDAAFAPPVLGYRMAAYADLAGWRVDDPQTSFSAYLKSCARLADDAAAPATADKFLGAPFGGTASDWLAPCRAAAALEAQRFADFSARREAIRGFFETHFRPVEILERRTPLPNGPARRAPPRIENEGLFTGYFEPVYAAAREPSARFSAPVYARPADLIDVDLGAFRAEWTGERLAGRIEEQRLVPYPDRRAIADGALAGRATPIAWMDPNDLFFLQVQGSGRLQFGDGGALRVGYAGQNGRAYTAIGRVMVERGVMAVENVTMESIRAWLASAPPAEARELREQNASYVFFEARAALDDEAGPLGAQEVSLTPGRSLAVDRRYHVLGAPVWVDIDPVEALGPARIRRLMIAQDTGGAIRGPLRGDVFWGTGDNAGAVAGAMRARGRLYVLLPQSLAARLP